jgi:HEAT repeat protein
MYNIGMDWFTNSKQGEAKKILPLLADESKRGRAAQDLIRLGADAVPVLMDALQTQDLGLIAIYQQILARIPSASPELIKALRSAHPLIRGRVAEVFAISRDRSAVSVLLEALRGEFFTVRARAAIALGNIGDTSALPAMLPLLKDPEVEVRLAACSAIGMFRDPSTFDELANVLLDDPQIEVRQAAVKALGDSRHSAAIPFLMEALRDPFWWFEREQNVRDLLSAIENMGGAVIEPLIEALTDREKTVRKFAIMILGKLRDIRAIEELGMALYDLHHEVSQAAAEALALFGESAFGVFREALHHPEADVRENAVHGLGLMQGGDQIPLLVEMLRDPDPVVKKQAIQSLGALQDRRAIPALQGLAANRADREIASLAKAAIEKIV